MKGIRIAACAASLMVSLLAAPTASAELYQRVSKDKSTIDEVLRIVDSPETKYTMEPKGVMPMVEFMKKTGAIKVASTSWKDMFFADAHALSGS